MDPIFSDVYDYVINAPKGSTLELDENQLEDLRDLIISVMNWNKAEESVYKNIRNENNRLVTELSMANRRLGEYIGVVKQILRFGIDNIPAGTLQKMIEEDTDV